MKIPFEPVLFGLKINVHLILEYVAFFTAFRYYKLKRKDNADLISNSNRLSIILGAIIGAFVGSRLIGFLEDPVMNSELSWTALLFSTKSIMGGLFGGLFGVEVSKIIIGEKQSSGDLFTYPIIVGIIIGRVGCFLIGVREFTYGSETELITGMDLGDGLQRHPIALYEIIFLLVLFVILGKVQKITLQRDGLLFKIFMFSYFGFRFCVEFIKPNTFFFYGLSSIQWLCIICWLYYIPLFLKVKKNANQKIYVL